MYFAVTSWNKNSFFIPLTTAENGNGVTLNAKTFPGMYRIAELEQSFLKSLVEFDWNGSRMLRLSKTMGFCCSPKPFWKPGTSFVLVIYVSQLAHVPIFWQLNCLAPEFQIQISSPLLFKCSPKNWGVAPSMTEWIGSPAGQTAHTQCHWQKQNTKKPVPVFLQMLCQQSTWLV